MGIQPRRFVPKLIAIGGMLSFITALYFYSGASFRFRLPSALFPKFAHPSCTPEDWSAGTWKRKQPVFPNANVTLKKPEDIYELNGLGGCAADREIWWHLGVDHEELWDRFPDAMAYEWIPGEKCAGVRPLTGEDLVRDLVERGGWLVLGGMFSPTCIRCVCPH